ncbi:transposase [Kitasatospora sp. NPDC088779]|uniref:IS110 family transposase n=1 Tax=unclassified Kitasatospora TaxID=2633591 RepID=UPI003422D805
MGQTMFGGVDSHADTIHLAVITDRGGHVADAEVPTTAAGYTAVVAFLTAHGTVTAIGVEGTSSYGSGFTRAARRTGQTVVETDRVERGRIGRSDPIEASLGWRVIGVADLEVLHRHRAITRSPAGSSPAMSPPDRVGGARHHAPRTRRPPTRPLTHRTPAGRHRPGHLLVREPH